jgi:hypothetical protein
MNNFELVCPTDGLSHFEEECDGGFFVKCHLCGWALPNPEFKSEISDFDMLSIISERWIRIRQGEQVDTPDKILAPKYSQNQIYGKLEEFEHRDLIEYGVSLRTGWLTEKGLKALNEESAKRK